MVVLIQVNIPNFYFCLNSPFPTICYSAFWRIMFGIFFSSRSWVGGCLALAVDGIWKTSSCTGLCAVPDRLAECKPPSELPHSLPALLSGSCGSWKHSWNAEAGRMMLMRGASPNSWAVSKCFWTLGGLQG